MSISNKTSRSVSSKLAEIAAGKVASATSADPKVDSIINANSLVNLNYSVYSGTILDTCPFCYSYKVMLSGEQAPIECCSLQTGGGNATMSFDSSFFAVGTTVMVARLPHSDVGIILGAIPVAGGNTTLSPRTNASMMSKNTPDNSDLACLPLATDKAPAVGIHNFGVGTPIDTTDVGDFGRMTLTGVKMMLNPFMALMALDDYTGLWLFEADSLLRLSGINVQTKSSGRETELFNDNGEYIEYSGMSLYPWEQLGYTKSPKSAIIKDTSRNDYVTNGSWKSFVEPGTDKAKPFHRVVDFGGWLGQGKQTQIVGEPEEEWLKYQSQETLNGLQRLSQTIDGMYSLISATGISITRRGVLPAITRVNRTDDTSDTVGDNQDNYEPNKFDIKPDIPTKSDNPAMERVMGLPDYLGYHQNFKELLPFLQHRKDYYVPEDSELNKGLKRTPDIGNLASKHLLNSDLKKKVKIDDNSSERKEQNVYALESGMVDLPDGSKVIYGGNGEEIRMVGGSIFFEAPGDINIKAGRNIVIWGGNDLEVRAKNYADISTSNGSLHIKAEKNLKLLGGNDKQSGVIIESRGIGDDYDFSKTGNDTKMPGIVLKAAESTVATLGGTVYTRSGSTGSGKGIFFDAGNGDQSIYTKCQSEITYLSDESVYNFSDVKTGDVQKTARMTVDGFYVPSSIYVDGDGMINGDTLCQSLVAVGSVIENNKEVRVVLDKTTTEMVEDKLPEYYKKVFQNAIVTGLYTEHKIGYDTTIISAGFTFREQDQYNVPSGFAVYAAKWQNICNNSGSGSSWEEPVVLNNESGEKTMPYPGKDYYEMPCFVTQTWTLIDTDNGLFKDRWGTKEPTAVYNNPQYGEQSRKLLKEYITLK